MPDAFYDSLAASYHLIFPDWDGAMRWQGEILRQLLPPPEQAGLVLDCACGIGTQALAARAGFDAVAVVPPAASGYYQPLVRARRPTT